MSAAFFCDRNIGGKLFPGRLREAGIRVHAHDDHFAPDAGDEEWIPAVAARGWIVLTRDRRIRYRGLEREAVFSSGAALIVLVGGNAPTPELARNFINSCDRVLAFLDANPPPFLAKLLRPNPVSDVERGRPGTLQRVLPPPG